jgi:hypothetical protein
MSCLQNKSEDIPTCEIEVIYELECQIKVPLHHLLCNFTPTSTKQVTGKMNQRNETAHLKKNAYMTQSVLSYKLLLLKRSTLPKMNVSENYHGSGGCLVFLKKHKTATPGSCNSHDWLMPQATTTMDQDSFKNNL